MTSLDQHQSMTPAATGTLPEHLRRLAKAPILLIASDFDGTLAPIVDDPAQAKPDREAVVAMRLLGSLPQTHVAVISGRALSNLSEMMGAPEDVHLVGSHGTEFDLDYATSLPDEAATLRDQLVEELKKIAGAHNGFSIEEKPAAVAFHYRNAEPDEAEHVLDKVRKGPGAIEGVFTRHGKKVMELSVVTTNKGKALEKIRHRVGASAVLYMGDDSTDEDAFSTLTGPDLGIKVGDGETIAHHRIKDCHEAAQLLARLAELREDWLAGAEAVPIEQHSMLSDQRTVGLVTPTARITWLCMPRIDSSAIFAELLGGQVAGHFSITPTDGSEPVEQKYVGQSLVLKTTWPTFSVTDFLDCTGGRPSQRAGRSELFRIIEGSGKITIEFAPRLDFGRVGTRLHQRNGGLAVEDTLDPIVLLAPSVQWEFVEEGDHQTARAEVELDPDHPLVLEMRYGTGSMRESSTTHDTRSRLTEQYWSSWAEQLELPSVVTEKVRHSAIVLKGLCHGPTGAIAAAGTTSLPEHIGGVRNWDYRYSWLRDAAMTASTLVKLGTHTEAMHYLDWVLGVIDSCESPDRLQPLYSVTGDMLGPEAEIGELSGYRGSRPVRIGNAASRQVQLDVFGPIVDLVTLLMHREAPLSSQHWYLVEAMVQAVEQRWHEPDHGIWEIRRPRRHHVHSKVMCWLTVDRAIELTRQFLERDREDWRALRDQIANDIFEKGYKQKLNAFTAAYDGTDADAATLHIGLTGLLPCDDPRFLGTVEEIERRLLKGPTVYRYRADDGLPGFEGGFHLCAAWLVEAYLRLGRKDDAWTLFEGWTALAGQTGMLSEQYGPNTKRSLGNVPQAYSHLALIENAISLAAHG